MPALPAGQTPTRLNEPRPILRLEQILPPAPVCTSYATCPTTLGRSGSLRQQLPHDRRYEGHDPDLGCTHRTVLALHTGRADTLLDKPPSRRPRARRSDHRRAGRAHSCAGPGRGNAGGDPVIPAVTGAGWPDPPQRSEGGHRRYSRRQLRRAERARELIDQGTPVATACRIITLEDQLAEHTDPPGPSAQS